MCIFLHLLSWGRGEQRLRPFLFGAPGWAWMLVAAHHFMLDQSGRLY
jgi:hypothetical protein